MKTIIPLILAGASFFFSSCTKETITSSAQISTTASDNATAVSMVVTRRTMYINNNVGGFLKALPSNYTTSKKYPLLISLHGSGDVGSGSNTDLAKIETKGVPYYIITKKFPATITVNGHLFSFVVIAPQFKNWPSNTDINNVIDFCLRYYSIDASRIYLTGLSMGGGAVWEYSRGYGERVTAIAPMAGASAPNTVKAQAIANKGVAVWAFHNNADPNVPVSNTNNYIYYINNYNPPESAKKTLFISNEHDCWTAACNPGFQPEGINVYAWMLKHKRNQ